MLVRLSPREWPKVGRGTAKQQIKKKKKIRNRFLAADYQLKFIECVILTFTNDEEENVGNNYILSRFFNVEGDGVTQGS